MGRGEVLISHPWVVDRRDLREPFLFSLLLDKFFSDEVEMLRCFDDCVRVWRYCRTLYLPVSVSCSGHPEMSPRSFMGPSFFSIS